MADNHVTIDDYQVFGDAFYLIAGYFRVLSMRLPDSTLIAVSLEFLKLSERSRMIAARIQKDKQEQEKMRQWKGLEIIGPALLVFGLFVFGGVRVAAQDVTPEVTPVIQPTLAIEPTLVVEQPSSEAGRIALQTFREYLPGLVNIIVVFIISVTVIAVSAIVVAGNGLPKWAKPILEAGKTAAISVGDAVVATTPAKYDDQFWATLKQLINEKTAPIVPPGGVEPPPPSRRVNVPAVDPDADYQGRGKF